MSDMRGISGWNTARVGNPYGAPMFVLECQTVAGTASYTYPALVKFRVVDVVAYATAAGAAADTITVKNGSTALTDAMDFNVSDKVIVRPATLDDAQRDFAVGDDLVVATASGAVGYVQVFCVRTE